jgi:hypothetical protein
MLSWIRGMGELSKVLRVMFQFVSKTRRGSAEVVSRMVPLIFAKVSEVGSVENLSTDHGIVSEYLKEQLDVFRQYFAVVLSIVGSSCCEAITMQPTYTLMPILVPQLVHAARAPPDFELPRQSLSILSKLVERIGDDPSFAEVNRFILSEALPSMLEHFTRGQAFDLKDSRHLLVVFEFCTLLKLVATKMSDAGVNAIFMSLTRVLATQHEASDVCRALVAQDKVSAVFKKDFHRLLETLQARR